MSDTPDLINIKVMGTIGNSYNIPINKYENISIRKLKELISEKCSIPTHVFDLSHQGKILFEDKNINDYSILENPVIHCIETTNGGKLLF